MTIDPRRSLVAGLIWLVIALAASFACAASLWAGRVARDIVVQQHVRRLVLETDQLASDLGQAVSLRLMAARSASPPALGPRQFEALRSAHPEQGWMALADAGGTVLASDGSFAVGSKVADAPWFVQALRGPWLGTIAAPHGGEGRVLLGDLAMPVLDDAGNTVGVVTARLTWPWAAHDLRRLSDALNPAGSAQTWVLDPDDVVRVGPEPWLDRHWAGEPLEAAPPIETNPGDANDGPTRPRFERLAGGIALVAQAPLIVLPGAGVPQWRVQLSEPKARVYERADALAFRIVWISACLGTLTALIGALGARHLTSRLRRLTLSAAAVGRKEIERIEVPAGVDEVSQLAAVLAQVLDDLRRERRELLNLSGELERRVALRTREVERLAEESRYAAAVRERLKMARDLHDTLAHSMMAMLSEIRLLRKLHARDPDSLPEELARAEEVAHAGLIEARTAITQMRVNVVRDTGLGSAIRKTFGRLLDRTGATGELRSDPEADRFGDERAEVMFRMAEEAFRNIERHAMASRVTVALSMRGAAHLRLQIRDDGVGFDLRAAAGGHYGLVGLREQAEFIGAELKIESVPGEGTTLTIDLRIAPETLAPLETIQPSTTED